MTWKPTDGLRRAESVVQQILADNIACGVPPMTNPTARWRMVKTIAEALDGFRSTIEPEFPLEEREPNGAYDTFTYTSDPSVETNPSTVVLRPGAEPDAIVGGVMIDHEAGKPAKRRGRGRPKLSASEKKKRKAAKQANAVEAEAAT